MEVNKSKKINHTIKLILTCILACNGIWFLKRDKSTQKAIINANSTEPAAGNPDYFTEYINLYTEADSYEALDVFDTDIYENSNQLTEADSESLAASNLKNLSAAGFSYDYLKSAFYVVESSTSITESELNGEVLLNKDMSVDLSGNDYKILIYHTHGSESFSDSVSGNTDDTVIGVGDTLTRILEEEYGISVYHDTTLYDMKTGSLDRSKAYDYARTGVSAILEEYPSIQVVIDLHRDGVAANTSLVTEINGKPTAQIMFLNGMSRTSARGDIDYLYNPNKLDNLAFSLQLYLTGEENYAQLMRKIYIKGYRYNLDLLPRALLVEVGGQTNTVEEAKNAMEPFGAILYKVLSGK